MSDIRTINTLSAQLVAKSKGTLIAPKEVINSIERLAPQAVETLEVLMLTAKAESVRLKAALELLALAGINKETKITVSTTTEEMSDGQINQRLNELLGTAQGIVIEGTAKDVTPKEKANA